MSERRLIRSLRHIGLTEKEIDTYLVILETEETIVSSIAEEAGVSRRHVYNIAVRLEERNLIEINDFVTPARLRVLPPEDVKRRLVTDTNELYDMLDDRFDRQEVDLKRVEVLKSRATFIKKIQQILRIANEQVTIAVPPTLLSAIKDELADAIERNVLVLLLLLAESDNTDLNRSYDGLAHAVRNHQRGDMAIQIAVDNSFGLIAPHEILSNRTTQSQAIAIGDPHLEPVVSAAFFGDQWNVSEEMYVTPPHPLPDTYLSFRLAVLQAALHLSSGARITAEIKAYPRAEGSRNQSPEHIEGEISEVNQRMIQPEVEDPVANLVLETESGTVSVGTRRCIHEDYEAIRTRLDQL